jgi:hypothetical protein
MDGMGRALVRHIDADADGTPRVPRYSRQGRTLVGGRATGRRRTDGLDARSLRGLGCTRTRAGIGDYAQRRVGLAGRLGHRLAPATMAGYITATRTFFRDAQEWGWCGRRFDPSTALTTPRSVRAMLGPKPRVIADDVWAKLLWAGLNLAADDLAAANIRAYPLELVHALALTWLFAAQRSDEIVRLRVGCIRWQRHDDADPAPSVCLLDVPVHKTGAAFTKPVDPLLGRAIEAWEAVRPSQPPMIGP